MRLIVAAVIAFFVVVHGISLIGSHLASTSVTADQTGIIQSSGGGQAAGTAAPSAIVTPRPRRAMGRTVYLRRVTAEQARLLGLVARATAIGAGGKISGSAFDALGSKAEIDLGTWSDVTPPAGLESFDRRWRAALQAADELSVAGDPYTRTDLRGARPAAVRCLSAFRAVGIAGQDGTYAGIAADLQRGLWVTSAKTLFTQSCRTISLAVLDRDAALLKGHRYRFKGDVFDLEFDTAYDYWDTSPAGFHSHTNLLLGVIAGGSGPWTNSIGVGFDQTAGQIHNDDTITIWGTCAGFCSFHSTGGKKVTLPLIRAKYVTVE